MPKLPPSSSKVTRKANPIVSTGPTSAKDPSSDEETIYSYNPPKTPTDLGASSNKQNFVCLPSSEHPRTSCILCSETLVNTLPEIHRSATTRVLRDHRLKCGGGVHEACLRPWLCMKSMSVYAHIYTTNTLSGYGQKAGRNRREHEISTTEANLQGDSGKTACVSSFQLALTVFKVLNDRLSPRVRRPDHAAYPDCNVRCTVYSFPCPSNDHFSECDTTMELVQLPFLDNAVKPLEGIALVGVSGSGTFRQVSPHPSQPFEGSLTCSGCTFYWIKSSKLI